MLSTGDNAISRLEQELLSVLKKEYGFYQSLFILLDKQRDLIKYDRDQNLLDLYSEIERCQRRIRESEATVTVLKEKNPKLFRLAAIHPEVKKMVNSITTLVKKSMALVEDNREYITQRHERIREEIGELKNSTKIMRYLSDTPSSPQFINGKS
ncbi:MAG: hypothetical protein KKA42_08835 [candidate division Zixibacteria bacterium]|nr:hypothetical protein [candidate division Zixibacteria bacterium]